MCVCVCVCVCVSLCGICLIKLVFFVVFYIYIARSDCLVMCVLINNNKITTLYCNFQDCVELIMIVDISYFKKNSFLEGKNLIIIIVDVLTCWTCIHIRF